MTSLLLALFNFFLLLWTKFSANPVIFVLFLVYIAPFSGVREIFCLEKASGLYTPL